MKKLGLIMLMLIMAISTGCGVEKNTTSQGNDNKGVESTSTTAPNTSVTKTTSVKTEAKKETTSADSDSSSDEVSDIQKNNPIDKNLAKIQLEFNLLCFLL